MQNNHFNPKTLLLGFRIIHKYFLNIFFSQKNIKITYISFENVN